MLRKQKQQGKGGGTWPYSGHLHWSKNKADWGKLQNRCESYWEEMTRRGRRR